MTWQIDREPSNPMQHTLTIFEQTLIVAQRFYDSNEDEHSLTEISTMQIQNQW